MSARGTLDQGYAPRRANAGVVRFVGFSSLRADGDSVAFLVERAVLDRRPGRVKFQQRGHDFTQIAPFEKGARRGLAARRRRAKLAPMIPSGAEACRPFLPAKDFDASRAFYEALGFEKLLDSEVAIFRAGKGTFILQRHYQKEWADNFMMQLMVDDLDAWWAHIQALDLPTTIGVKPPKSPAMQPWGLREAYIYDPTGVLWHIAQRRSDAPAD